MADAMVSARMAAARKESGNAMLKQLGTNASQAINELYDCILENRALPFPRATRRAHSREEIERAIELIDGIPTLSAGNRFSTMTDKQIRAERLRSRGQMAE